MANKSPDSLFSPSISESQTLESIDHSPGSKQRSFLQMIYNRVTKKKFLEKQKLKFMKSRGRTKHPSDYEEYELNTQRIDNLEEILRNIREKSVHKIHIKNIKESFQSGPEIMAYADKLKEYQTKFLSHLLKKRKTQESELVDINNSLLKRIMNTKLEKNKSLFCKREDYYRMKLSKSVRFSSSPLRAGSKMSNNNYGSTESYFHGRRSVARRFCPPISSPDLSLGNRNRMRFTARIEMEPTASFS